MLVVLILALMLSGVVEFGYLLNSYLKVLDGAREAARFSASSIAFGIDPDTGVFGDYEKFYTDTAKQAMRVMSPIKLIGNQGDNIVISVFSVVGSSIVRWPIGYAFGWNLCDKISNPTFNGDRDLADWSSCSTFWQNKRSKFSTAQILTMMDPNAPASGVLLVEVYYNYSQILKLPIFEQAIPDPMAVYTYSVMPISSAEPTPTPGP
jgi:hypothetical protein